MTAQKEIKVKIEEWNQVGGYGFARVDGRLVFVHATNIHPHPVWGADLTGREVTLYQIDWGYKRGPRATNAYLHETILDSFARGLEDLMKNIHRR